MKLYVLASSLATAKLDCWVSFFLLGAPTICQRREVLVVGRGARMGLSTEEEGCAL